MPPRRAWVPIYGHYPQARLIARGRVRGNAGRRRRGGNGRRFVRPGTTGLACVRIVANGWQGSRETPAGSALRAKRWRDGLAPLPPAVGAYPEFLRAPNFAGLPALRIHLRAPDRRRPHLRKSISAKRGRATRVSPSSAFPLHQPRLAERRDITYMVISVKGFALCHPGSGPG